ncbi:hypothetical protein COUCH_16150 [Couchioplanes caeruleus]|uniref:prenyltransferase/squalene oxidase repeat-containing protein n=1 Tax=Couchioplanes caeruleus TaxID=56438 RepID=UPI0020C01AD7|nr:prenyltransferase/squalene oxidase repeat-containing protein [Couchioplanes caeruleus]UQU67708.1 hypothetical protein COUCH_16150 [Couchioplanes caeruleus]
MTALLADVAGEVGRRLLAIRHAPTSDLGPSWYDTAQVLRFRLREPRLLPDDLAYAGLVSLLEAQQPDGGWGPPEMSRGYRTVPTLAAATMLCALGTAQPPEPMRTRAATATRAALTYLAADPHALAPAALPDLIAVEFTVPALLESLVRALAPDDAALPGVRVALSLHRDGLRALHRHRAAAASGARLPAAAHYSLEVLDGLPAAFAARPLADGSLACSPAATAAAAAWSGRPSPAAAGYLTAEGRRLGGAWPTVAPVTVFEAAHLAGVADRAGLTLPAAVSAGLGPWLAAQLGEAGCGAGPALAPDSDDTAIVLVALQALGRPADVRLLAPYEHPTHFATFPGERSVSSSTNAHVLEALCGARDAGSRDAFIRRGIAVAGTYLLDVQHPDGHWDDKWHASPYYATASAVAALRRLPDPRSRAAVARAADWVRGTRRSDGAWGRWRGTREETAYAWQISGAAAGARLPETPGGAALWHAKELYEPRRITGTLALIATAGGHR